MRLTIWAGLDRHSSLLLYMVPLVLPEGWGRNRLEAHVLPLWLMPVVGCGLGPLGSWPENLRMVVSAMPFIHPALML